MNAGEQDATRSREEHYQEVSLRAVELLAKAQRAADEAVAEAQSYARDLEESAREQYKQILQRAKAAAQELASAEGETGGAEPAAAGAEATGEATSALDAQQLTYVRTYARVAHAQLKSVLAALNDELDQLAAMAEGAVPGSVPGAGTSRASESAAGLRVPPGQPAPAAEGAASEAGPAEAGSSDAGSPDAQMGGDDASGRRGRRAKAADTDGGGSSSDPSWPPIFAATNSISYVHRGSAWEGQQF